MEFKSREIELDSHGARIAGTMTTPPEPVGVVIFAHGSGSSRFSQRNQQVAKTLQAAGCTTLLMDLLTDAETRDRNNVFNIPLLADRLTDAKRWVEAHPEAAGMAPGSRPPIAYFGASTGAGAALYAAAQSPQDIVAVVSRGGRPDLADECLGSVYAPTLLLVGGADEIVIGLNQKAYQKLACEKEIQIIPGATHLFVEEGALEAVSDLAKNWLLRHFTAHRKAGMFPVPA